MMFAPHLGHDDGQKKSMGEVIHSYEMCLMVTRSSVRAYRTTCKARPIRASTFEIQDASARRMVTFAGSTNRLPI